MTNINNTEKLLLATEIHDKFMQLSTSFDDNSKLFFIHMTNHIRDFVKKNGKLNSYQFKTFKNELLTYWNESIKPETEYFWAELSANNIDFERNQQLSFALEKKRFRNVELGIDARNYWNELKQLTLITRKYNEAKIIEIENIIESDEKSRLEVLKKVLSKKKIPNSLYLKFGECMAYFSNCKLFEKYFTTNQVAELYKLWNLNE